MAINNTEQLDSTFKQLIAKMASESAGGQYGNAQNLQLAQFQQMANKDPRYAMGALAGQMLRQLKDNYDARGQRKGELQDELRTKFGDNAANMIQGLQEQGIWDNYKKLSEFAQTYNPEQQVNHQAMTGDPRQAAIDKALPANMGGQPNNGLPNTEQLLGNGSDNSELDKMIAQKIMYDKAFGGGIPNDWGDRFARR